MRILKKLSRRWRKERDYVQDLHMEVVVLDWKRNLFSQKEMKLMNWRLWGDNVEQVKRTVQVRCVTYRDLQREYDESHLFIAVSLFRKCGSVLLVWVGSTVNLEWRGLFCEGTYLKTCFYGANRIIICMISWVGGQWMGGGGLSLCERWKDNYCIVLYPWN